MALKVIKHVLKSRRRRFDPTFFILLFNEQERFFINEIGHSMDEIGAIT